MTDEHESTLSKIVDKVKDATRGLGSSLENAAEAMPAANDAGFAANPATNPVGTTPVEGMAAEGALTDDVPPGRDTTPIRD